MWNDEQTRETVEWLQRRGPAVILGNPQSLFVTQLGRYWSRLGLDVRIVSTGPNLPDENATGLPTIDSLPMRPLWTRLARPLNVVLRPSERILPRLLRRRYRRQTGLDSPRAWELFWVDHYWDSYSRAAAATQLRPAFVFAQEAAAYGLSAARCTSTTRVIFPWGGDITISCEASPVIAAMIRRAFHNVELIVPSSSSAKDRICQRFDVAPERVTPISWGVDLEQFHRLTGDDRTAARQRFGLPVDSVVLMNVRRFDPLWGGNDALEAAIAMARQHRNVFCVFLGGGYDTSLVAAARRQVQQAGLTDQFRFFEEAVSVDQYAQLVGVSDISLSLMTLADMRSSSVLQAAAAGGVPVIGDTPEHQTLRQQGFSCRLIPAGDRQQVLHDLDELIRDADLRESIVRRNRQYLETHEDHDQQMSRLLEAIAAAIRQRDDGPKSSSR